MNTKMMLLLIAAACTIATGCRSDHDAGADRNVAEAGLHEAHLHDEPAITTATGRVSGFDCAVVGELCPTTHRGGDYTTGVYTEDGSFYFVVNIPQSFLTQYFLKNIEVEGRVYSPYDYALEPEVIHVLEDDDRRLVYEAGYFIDEENGRATFHDGQFIDGRWVAP